MTRLQAPVPELRIDGLSVAYGGTAEALTDVALRIAPGDTVALLGANGAGKTTLVRAITGTHGFYGGRIVGGDVSFGDDRITDAPPRTTVRLGITQVPEGRQMFQGMTVEENLRLGGMHRPRALLAGEIDEALSYFPAIATRRQERAGLLSGGEQQMVALARAIVARPRLFVVDELTLGLSPRIVEDLIERLLVILDVTQAGLLLVEQNARLALDVCRYGYVLERGKVATEGASGELRRDPRVQASYLGGGELASAGAHIDTQKHA